MGLRIEPAYDNAQAVETLFSEYTDMLIEGASTFREYLNLQNYDEELQHLDIKYGLPHGRLYLAYWEDALAGCIGYSHMLLDTLPFLESAIHVYKTFGFYEVESYNNSPMETSIYMQLDL